VVDRLLDRSHPNKVSMKKRKKKKNQNDGGSRRFIYVAVGTDERR
jgi:hypothetical protein